MLGIAAAVFFGIAFVINATETSTSILFSPTSLMLFGLVLLALQVSGIGAALPARGRGRRR
ncbi:hypothetical protein ACPXCE_17860 [Streptomyces sp. DT24]|uniref:hypothetical protein n=1 Tax=unclassified Streptomyces TaxID=2593676 RepID=UPI0023B9C4A2|nr:hypothetical protein [Streptomyces sp. AM 4-1-1]WEH32105.1 hypothetical protein PZB75_01135 [Streptomyces sp. AM 4-1-1]